MVKIIINILLLVSLKMSAQQEFHAHNYIVPSASGLMLDSVATGATGAWSFRRINTAYTGNLIRVRESGGNTEQNIGYDGSGILDTAALKTFVGANNGFLVTWYDQSGNGYNVGGVTSAQQPRIITSGVIERQGGKVSAAYGNTSLGNTGVAVTPANGFTFFTVANGTSASYGTSIGNTLASGARWALGQSGNALNGNGWAGPSAGVNLGADASYNTFSVKSWIKSSTQWEIRRNNSLLTTVSDNSSSVSTFNLCIGDEGYSSGAYDFTGHLSEVIMFNAQLNSTERQLIERNQGAFYGITVL